jgi:hypothetical protein
MLLQIARTVCVAAVRDIVLKLGLVGIRLMELLDRGGDVKVIRTLMGIR